MKQVHLIISGDVQGVGFRSWIAHNVKHTPLTGWVTNREDKAVEVVAQGNDNDLNLLVSLCQKGPDVAWIKHVDITWGTVSEEFDGFRVIY